MDAAGKLIMECLLETKASTIVEFIQGLQGTLSLTFEEPLSSLWKVTRSMTPEISSVEGLRSGIAAFISLGAFSHGRSALRDLSESRLCCDSAARTGLRSAGVFPRRVQAFVTNLAGAL
jgi:hypothetical protein